MRSRLVSVTSILGLVAIVVIMTLPRNTMAAAANEINTYFYSCPEGAVTLAECTWNGERHRDCTGGLLVEGSLTGNYKVTETAPCHSVGGGGTSCVFWSDSQGWIQVACFPTS